MWQTWTIWPAFRTAARIHRCQFAVKNKPEPAITAVWELKGCHITPQVQAVTASDHAPILPMIRTTLNYFLCILQGRIHSCCWCCCLICLLIHNNLRHNIHITTREPSYREVSARQQCVYEGPWKKSTFSRKTHPGTLQPTSEVMAIFENVKNIRYRYQRLRLQLINLNFGSI